MVAIKSSSQSLVVDDKHSCIPPGWDLNGWTSVPSYYVFNEWRRGGRHTISRDHKVGSYSHYPKTFCWEKGNYPSWFSPRCIIGPSGSSSSQCTPGEIRSHLRSLILCKMCQPPERGWEVSTQWGARYHTSGIKSGSLILRNPVG